MAPSSSSNSYLFREPDGISTKTTSDMSSGSLGEERQFRLALASEGGEVELGGADPPCVRERPRLRLELLRGEDAAAGRAGRVEADALEVARELLHRVDRADALDLDGDPASVLVATHEVDGPEV